MAGRCAESNNQLESVAKQYGAGVRPPGQTGQGVTTDCNLESPPEELATAGFLDANRTLDNFDFFFQSKDELQFAL